MKLYISCVSLNVMFMLGKHFNALSVVRNGNCLPGVFVGCWFKFFTESLLLADCSFQSMMKSFGSSEQKVERQWKFHGNGITFVI